MSLWRIFLIKDWCGRIQLAVGGPELFKKRGWTSLREQASKPWSSMATTMIFHVTTMIPHGNYFSACLRVPVLNVFHSRPNSEKWNKSSPPQIGFAQYFITAIVHKLWQEASLVFISGKWVSECEVTWQYWPFQQAENTNSLQCYVSTAGNLSAYTWSFGPSRSHRDFKLFLTFKNNELMYILFLVSKDAINGKTSLNKHEYSFNKHLLNVMC